MKFIFTFLLTAFGLPAILGQGMAIDRLSALNLEEDKGHLATMNDELMLIWGVVDMTNDTLVFWQYSEIYEVNDSINEVFFKSYMTPKLDSNSYMFFALIEIDDAQTSVAISDGFQLEFMHYYAHPYNLLKEQLRLKLKDNDLLGFVYVNAIGLAKIDNPIRFKGMHLFNRFEYELYLSFY